ncbi:alpha/beta fold hydrolase [Streptomyces sp. NPDC101455]|uniref:alpha/beta fold hydrolase n=1 Tax=Streptomyces sp. NPDC101455 TaxID=3366142 RepID=UPI00382780C1
MPEPSSYWASLLGADVRQINGKYSTRVIECGSGPALILLHGTGGHLENYALNIPRLARHFRVIACDFLWHGRSQTSGFDPEIIPLLVDQVVDVMNALDIDAASIEGQSLGGWVAMRLALSHPTRVAHLVLTTAMGYAPDPDRIPGYVPPVRDANLASSLSMLDEPSFDNVRGRMSRILADPSRLTDEAVLVRQAIYQQPALREVQRSFITEYLQGSTILRHEVTDAVARRIVHPTLVYWGDRNRVPASVGERLAGQVHDGRFHCATDTGHWAQYESADEHDAVVSDFLLRTTSAQEALG